MPYVTQDDLAGLIPASLLAQALTDVPGEESVWETVVAQVTREIDAALSGRYTLPLAEPYPAFVTHAATVLVAEAAYARRGIASDRNPFSSRASSVRRRLEKIAEGSAPLTPDLAPSSGGGGSISSPAAFDSGGRRIA